MTHESDDSARVASEARHRMANTLQLLSALARMRSQRASEPESRRQLLWMADAIGSLGTLERHRVPGGVDFAAYLTEMTPVWRRRNGGQSVEVTLITGPITAPDQAASTLALIIQELVINALAHGYADSQSGHVEIRLDRRPDDRWELVVTDDGRGFDPGLSTARERFGLWFVRSLSAQVRGEFSLSQGPGVVARMIFSL